MWRVEQVSPNTARMRVAYERNFDWEFYILLTADRHIDHANTDLSMQHRHLKQAQQGGWPVVDVGDLFCAMQGKRDPRSSRKALLDKLNEKEQYMDAIVDYAYEFASPYKNVWALMGLGNHETGALKHNETHLLNRLVDMLNEDGSPVVLGGYQGWLRLQFEVDGGAERRSLNIRYTHGGAGTSAPVTKGTIQATRRAAIFPDAHIVCSGHTHEQWMFIITRTRLNSVGKELRDEQLHLQVPSYKDETTEQTEGYAVEKEHPPKPIGAWWIKFWWERPFGVRYDAVRAT